MDWSIISYWFKNTIPGIIILGAFGSIIAYYIIKICHWIIKRYLKDYISKFPIRYIRQLIIHYELSRKLKQDPDTRLQIIHLIYGGIAFLFTTIVLFSFLIVTILFFAIKGPILSIFSILLVIGCFLLFSLFLKDGITFWATLLVNLGKEIREMEKKFEDDKVVLSYRLKEENEQKQIKDKAAKPSEGN